MMYLVQDSETLNLGSMKNKMILQQDLSEKGYWVVNKEDDADVIVIGEYFANSDYATVTLLFTDKVTGDIKIIH